MADQRRNCSYTTSWSVIDGCLDRSIAVESSDSPVDDDVYSSTSKYRGIVLQRRPSESYPCEIHISFAQKHEIRQVYVRSSARIYELYCASDEEGGSDYLCTARCSLATETENAGQRMDLYEATAEISGSNPCTSLTIRLLSLQNKECVQVNEIYVFAERIDLTGNASLVENSTGNAFISEEPKQGMGDFSGIKECKCSGMSDIDRTLNSLVLRVSRLEDMLLKFEGRILNPLTSIDARVKNVEEKLQMFNRPSPPSPGLGSACSSKEEHGAISPASSSSGSMPSCYELRSE